MEVTQELLIIAVAAGITFMLRALPFLAFRGTKTMPVRLRRLGDMLPSAIMAVLIIYCLKDVGDDFMEDGLWRLAAVGVVAVTYKWKHQTLLSIVSGTVFYMVLLAVV